MAIYTHLFDMAGLSFYEHPMDGDEAPMQVKWNGLMIETEFYDMPNRDEALELLAQLKATNPAPITELSAWWNSEDQISNHRDDSGLPDDAF